MFAPFFFFIFIAVTPSTSKHNTKVRCHMGVWDLYTWKTIHTSWIGIWIKKQGDAPNLSSSVCGLVSFAHITEMLWNFVTDSDLYFHCNFWAISWNCSLFFSIMYLDFFMTKSYSFGKAYQHYLCMPATKVNDVLQTYEFTRFRIWFVSRCQRRNKWN